MLMLDKKSIGYFKLCITVLETFITFLKVIKQVGLDMQPSLQEFHLEDSFYLQV